MAIQPLCPDPDRLRGLLDGRLTEEEQADLTRHVGDCADCRRRMEELAGGIDCLPPESQDQRPRSGEAALRGLVEAVKTQRPMAETAAEQPTAGDVQLDFLEPPEEPGHLGRLGEYQILEVMGRGGMGVVLKAYEPTLKRVVAIKVLSSHLASNVIARKRFLRESQAAAAISHDHVVAIHTVGEIGGLPFMVMECIGGVSLDARIKRTGPLKVEETLRIGMQTASGLAAAHAQGVVHRDIKPANILLENGVERVKLTDFGLARAVDDVQITQTGVVAGTPEYMSPEQARGETVDHRSDLFSLGCVLYAMCTGRSPFRATTLIDAIRRVCDETPRPIRDVNPEIPDWLTEIIDRLLAKDKQERFQSAEEVADVLGKYLVHVQNPALEVSLPERLGPRKPAQRVPSRRRRLVWGVGLILLLAAGIVSAELMGWTRIFRLASTSSSPPNGGESSAGNQLAPNLTVTIADGDLQATLTGAKESRTLTGVGDHSVHLPPGRYAVDVAQLQGGSRIRHGEVEVSEKVSTSIGIYELTPLPWMPAQAELRGHYAGVICLAFSPDGGELATASWDCTVRLWRRSGEKWDEHAVLPTRADHLAFSPDGKLLAILRDDQPVQLLDVASHKPLRRLEVRGTALAFSADGRKLAVGTLEGDVAIWDVERGTQSPFGRHDRRVNAVAFSPSNNVLASASHGPGGNVKLWDPERGVELRTLQGQGDDVMSVAFAPDGKTLASASSDYTTVLWDVGTGRQIDSFVHDRAVSPCEVWLDAKRFAVSHHTGVRIWHLDSGELVDERRLCWHGIRAMAVSPDGRTLATGGEDHAVRLWSVSEFASSSEGTLLIEMPGPTKYKVIVTGEGYTKTFTELGSQQIRLREGLYKVDVFTSKTEELLRSGTVRVVAGTRGRITPGFLGDSPRAPGAQPEPLVELPCGEGVTRIAFADASTLATGAWRARIHLWKSDGHVWSRVLSLMCGMDQGAVVAFSTDGKLLATQDDKGDIKLWDCSTGASHATLAAVGHGAAQRVAFSADQKSLAVAHNDGQIVLWDWPNHKAIATLNDGDKLLHGLAFSPDGRLLASAGVAGTVSIWDLATRARLHVLRGHTDAVLSLAFSPDGKTLASAGQDTTVRLWNVQTGESIRIVSGHQAWVTDISFSPDGSMLASAELYPTVRLWDVASGSLRKEFVAHWGYWTRVAFSPNGGLLATGGGDFTARLWSLAQLTKDEVASIKGPQPKSIFFPAGPCAAFSGAEGTLAIGNSVGSLNFWQTDSWAAPVTVEVLPGEPFRETSAMSLSSLVFGPDGKRLASTARDKKVRLWDWDSASQTCKAVTAVETDRTDSPLAMSPAGKILAVGRAGGVVRLLNADTGMPFRDLTSTRGGIVSLAISGDGNRLAAGTDDGYVVLWDPTTGKLQGELQHGSGRVRSVAFAPKDKTVVTAGDDAKVQLWDLATRIVQRTFDGHASIVFSASFSPDGGTLVTAGGDYDPADPWKKRTHVAEVKLWEAATGKLLTSFAGHRDAALQAFFLPDGKTLVTTGADAKTHFWDVNELLSETGVKENRKDEGE